MADGLKPEVKAALAKGAIAEAVLLLAGGALAFSTGEMAWIIGAAVAGSAVLVLLMAQAGAFSKSNDRQ